MRLTLKIVVVANHYLPEVGGASQNTHGICRQLAQRHKVTVLTPKRDNQQLYEEIEGVQVKRFRPLRNRAGGFLFCPAMIKELGTGAYDLVHFSPSLSRTVKVMLLQSRVLGLPAFLTIYDLLDYEKYDMQRFTNRELLEMRFRPSRMTRWCYRTLQGVFTISLEEREALAGIVRKPMFIPCGVDLAEFDRARDTVEAAREESQIVLCVGRIVPYKGQDVLLATAAEIIRRVPGARFVLAGPIGDASYYEQLRSMIREQGIEQQVEFTGPLSREELLRWYFRCTLNVVPVRFLNSGLVNLETWAAGKPLVQSDRNYPNLVVEGVDGFTFELNDRNQLTEGVVAVLSDSELQKSMGRSGRRKVEAEFTFAKIADRIEREYLRILNCASASRL